MPPKENSNGTTPLNTDSVAPSGPISPLPDSLKVASQEIGEGIEILNDNPTASIPKPVAPTQIPTPETPVINNVATNVSQKNPMQNEESALKTPFILPDEKKIPAPDNTPKTLADSVLIRPLRTYEDDVKEAMSTQNASVARIVLSEQKKKEKEIKVEEKNSIKSPVNIKKILIAILLVAVGGGISYGAYLWQKSRPVETRQALIRPPIIETDSQIEVVVGDKNKSEALGSMRQTLDARFAVENVREIFLTKTVVVTTAEGSENKKAALNTEDFFGFIGAIPPSRLTRSLNKEFLLGVYSLSEENDPFLLFKVDDYENAFISMLEWEKTLVRDITPIFYKNFDVINPEDSLEEVSLKDEVASTPESTSTTTSTTTPSEDGVASSTENVAPVVVLPQYDPRDFKDVVLNNRDTRLIKNNEGKTLFFYTFIDKTTLIMTTDNETLGEVIKRLRTARLIR